MKNVNSNRNQLEFHDAALTSNVARRMTVNYTRELNHGIILYVHVSEKIKNARFSYKIPLPLYLT